MGLGDPVGLVEAVHHGIDMFDCVLPTRLARHGTALTSAGRVNLRNLANARDDGPIDPAFTHDLSGRFSRAYLRHLLVTREPTAGRIITPAQPRLVGGSRGPDAQRDRAGTIRRVAAAGVGGVGPRRGGRLGRLPAEPPATVTTLEVAQWSSYYP